MTNGPNTRSVPRRVSVNGIELAVTEYAGSGPALILLHGIGSRGVSWWPVVEALAARFHLIVPDLRGHGASDKPPAGYLVGDYAADLAALVDALELARPHILGHSLGGIVALNWAVAHPARAASIALEDTALRGGPRTAPLFDGWLALATMSVADAAASYQREHPDWSDEDCRRRAESITATTPPVFTELRDWTVANPDGDPIARLAVIAAPVLLVYGDIDAGGLVVPSDAARLAETVPNAQVVRIAGGSHSLHRDRTAEFLAVVTPFLTGAETTC